MKITRRQLRQIIKEELSPSLQEQYEPRDQNLPDPLTHDFTGPIGRSNILRKWICMRGIPGGEGDEQWGWMRVQANKKIKYGNWGDQKIAEISALSIVARINKSFDDDELRVTGFMRGAGGKLMVSGQVYMGRMLGWKGTGEGRWESVSSPLANEVVRTMLTQLYAEDGANIELKKDGVPVVGDVTIYLEVTS